ncbi:hypothetical protein CXB51_026145 [Gossypium anomalum]|uniref:Reverse transcriptase zinc-binding domain-containing protein n=1 Tax=Gossypium anomalum TaxID=47600 RepID=A0A8J6CVE2_9ROSI|nr:hypothetical protein CXB51_026145 [Gossypium anomalum]
MGGPGIRYLRLFNLALLGRQVWRLINNKDSLCFKVPSSKYFPEGNIFKAKKEDKASFTWSSIAAGAKVLKDGFGWQGMEGLNWETIRRDSLNQNVMCVKDLWLEDRRSWNVKKVKSVYGHDWGDKICNIPIGDEGQDDKVIWFHNPRGCFTSKFAYSWLLLKEIGYGPHRFFWKAIWKLDTLPKVRVFTWRVGHEILPTNEKIASIRHGFDKGCPRCGAETETLLHSLKDCPTSRAVLSLSGWPESTISKKYDHCIDWLEDMMRVLDRRAMVDLMGKEEEAKIIWERASTLNKEFRICNSINEPLLSQNSAGQKWKKPSKGFIKINFDATVGENRIAYGMIIRDDEGFVLGGVGLYRVKAVGGRG